MSSKSGLSSVLQENQDACRTKGKADTQVTVTRDETYEEGMQSTSGGRRGENGWRGFQMEPGRINSSRVL